MNEQSCPVFFPPTRKCKRLSKRKHMVAGRRHLAVRFACKAWFCPACAPAIKQQWCQRLFLALCRDGVETTFHVATDPGGWGALQKRLNRAGACHVRVQTPGVLHVLSTAELPGSAALPMEKALRHFADVLGEADVACAQPVRAGNGWLPPPPRKDGTRWHFAGDIPASDRHLADALAAERERGAVADYKVFSPTAAAWTFAAGLSQGEQGLARQRLFGHILNVAAVAPCRHAAANG